MDAKRIAFIEQNKCWIDFLNDYNSGVLRRCKEETLVEKRLSGEIVSQNKINLLVVSDRLAEIQKKIHPDKRFASEKEFITAIAEWMYENLKRIGDGATELIYTEKVNTMLLETLLNQIRVSLINYKHGGYDYGFGNFGTNSKVPYITKCLHLFVNYTLEAIAGLGEKAKLGIYKVGVCPYHKLKDKKPCGVVFVGEKLDQKACKKHANVWRVLTVQRAKLAQIAKDYKKLSDK